MRLAFVVQRYGAGIAGGSEMHCRQLAERLASRHDITVLTTCARDYVTWENAYPPGVSTEGGVRVHRFPVARPRNLKTFADLSDEVFDDLGSSPEREDAWFRANGPDAPALLDHLRSHGKDYDLVLFWAFRYAPSYFGVPLVADRAVLVPTAEEDPAVDLDVLPDFFARPAGYLFLTPEEETLVSTRAGRPLRPSRVIGIGLEPERDPHPSADAIDRLGLPEDFVLYLGRVDRNKGCATLLEYFQDYVDAGGQHASPKPRSGEGGPALVLAGPSTLTIPDHPRIRALGYVEDAVRHALLSHARALIVPSPYESLSIVLLEGWNHATPALVNAHCKVLQGQVRRANGGLYYRSSREFQEALSWLLSNETGRRELGEQGLAYVEREYRWPTVLERVESLLEEVSRRRSAARA
ncbi:MAG TPA: glycosyltransferase family 4 protein [Vicinamibacterales bacterium]